MKLDVAFNGSLRQRAELLSSSYLFEAEFYRQQCPDLKGSEIDLAEHYLAYGSQRGLHPNRYFDPVWYSMRNPDVVQVGLEPFVHYIISGAAEDRRPGPHFDPKYYRTQHACTESDLLPLAHYLSSGVTSDLGLDSYVDWMRRYDTIRDFDRARIRSSINEMRHRPLISIVMPVYNTPEKFLRKAIGSVQNQLYPNWELCIADDNSLAPHVARVLHEYASQDERIKIVLRSTNGHISAASNSALQMASGDFIALLDHDDELSEHALFLAAKVIERTPSVDLIYSDEDRLTSQGQRYDPYFKSSWNPSLILGQNFFCHLGIYRHALVQRIGGFDPRFDGSQDYDLLLRAIEATTADKIVHIPHVLYHWRSIPGSTASESGDQKPYALNAANAAIQNHIKRCGLHGNVEPSLHPAFHRVKWDVRQPQTSVSIIVAYQHEYQALLTTTSILDKTAYANFNVILCHDAGYSEAQTLELVGSFGNERVSAVWTSQSHNPASIRNHAASFARGRILCFLDAGLRIEDPDWLRELVSQYNQPEIGVVAPLIKRGNVVHQAGLYLDQATISSPVCRGLEIGAANDFGYFGRAALVQDLSAVASSCLVVPRSVFQDLDGFNTQALGSDCFDVDLCLKARKSGLRVLWTPYSVLQDSRHGRDARPAAPAVSYMRDTWQGELHLDPFYNPNLRLEGPQTHQASPPRKRFSWLETYPLAPAISASDAREAVAASGLFHPEWYRSRYGSSLPEGADLLEDYLTCGSAQERFPNPEFDPSFYLDVYPDVGATGLEPLAHYVLIGKAEHRCTRREETPLPSADLIVLSEDERGLADDAIKRARPRDAASRSDREIIQSSGFFSAQWYHRKYPDVQAARVPALDHYLEWGWKEGRQPNPNFDTAWYLDKNPDVAQSGAEPFSHFLRYGIREGRLPKPLTMLLSQDKVPELSDHPVIKRFLQRGRRLSRSVGRSLGISDLVRIKDPDEIKTGSNTGGLVLVEHLDEGAPDTAPPWLDAVEHHVARGRREDWQPSSDPDPKRHTELDETLRFHNLRKLIEASGLFDAARYLRENPDVREAGVDPLDHYLGNGWKEGRTPNAAFEPGWYHDRYMDKSDDSMEPLAHYLLIGAGQNLQPSKAVDMATYVGFSTNARLNPLAHHLLTNAPALVAASGADPLRLTNLPDLEVPDFFELRGLKPVGRIAVVVHLFYPELWEEMADAIRNIDQLFDLFVTLVANISDKAAASIKEDFPNAYIYTFPQDRGRDIARFIALLQTGALFRYDLICKVHSKRSTYVADGDEWRRQLIDGILGSKEQVNQILAHFDSDPDLGMVVANGNIYGGEACWSGNEAYLDKLLPRIGISTNYSDRSFPGGGIFWCRAFLLRSLLGSGIRLNDFELEPMPVNGALGHAAERMYGLICEDAGMKVCEWRDLEDKVASPTQDEIVAKTHVFAFFLPQFHPVKENNAWWGEGFTEWTNVTRARSMYAGHRQPMLPSDLGFCDLRLAETRIAQAALAKEYGITGFCFYYYWFNGRMMLERPLKEILESGEPRNPFMVCWANEPWSRNWDGANHEVLLSQTYEPGWERLFAADVAPLLRDSRYYRLDGKPMLLIYRVRHIPNLFEAMQTLREAFRAKGVGEIHLCAGLVHFRDEAELLEHPSELGFDSYYEFPPHRIAGRLLSPRPEDLDPDFGILFDYGTTIETAIDRLKEPASRLQHRGVMVGFDNTSRRGKGATIFHGATPTNFRRWLRQAILRERQEPGQRLIFINAWNEWAEGAVLEPDQVFGRGRLEAVASALGFRR